MKIEVLKSKTSIAKTWLRKIFYVCLVVFIIFIVGLITPDDRSLIPVKDATAKDWHEKSFWYYPWGTSGVHRGVDIFAPYGQPVIASTGGIVVQAGVLKNGGQVVTILGPKWRLHYYAHMSEKNVRVGYIVSASDQIGKVGNTGNAINKPPHLHYSIFTLIPYFWRSDETPYGSQKKWYINPIPRLTPKNANQSTTNKAENQDDQNQNLWNY